MKERKSADELHDFEKENMAEPADTQAQVCFEQHEVQSGELDNNQLGQVVGGCVNQVGTNSSNPLKPINAPFT